MSSLRILSLMIVMVPVAALTISCSVSEEPMASDLVILVEMPSKARVGDQVNLRLTVANQGDSNVTLDGFRPEFRYDFRITDDSGHEVWRSLYDVVGSDDEVEWTVSPSQEIVHEAVWGTSDNLGFRVPTGTYFVQGIVALSGDDLESEPGPIEIVP